MSVAGSARVGRNPRKAALADSIPYECLTKLDSNTSGSLSHWLAGRLGGVKIGARGAKVYAAALPQCPSLHTIR